MAKPFAQVVTMQDVYEYARDSFLAAIKPGCIVPAGPNKGLSCYCPQSAPQYQNLANKIKADMAAGVSGMAAVATYKSAIMSINAACRKEAGYQKPTPATITTPNGVPNGVQMAGFPWWIVLLLGGGALAYYLATKKDKAPSKARRRSKRKGKYAARVRAARARRKR